jgi:hypothetical protein
MAEDEQPEDFAARRARERADRRARKRGPRQMDVSGKSVFLIKQIIQEKAQAARRRRQAD